MPLWFLGVEARRRAAAIARPDGRSCRPKKRRAEHCCGGSTCVTGSAHERFSARSAIDREPLAAPPGAIERLAAAGDRSRRLGTGLLDVERSGPGLLLVSRRIRPNGAGCL